MGLITDLRYQKDFGSLPHQTIRPIRDSQCPGHKRRSISDPFGQTIRPIRSSQCPRCERRSMTPPSKL
ncbi:hypothetical protein CR513_50132, partial [Mucuna pruriens]